MREAKFGSQLNLRVRDEDKRGGEGQIFTYNIHLICRAGGAKSRP
jgi:hypothetical protein